MRSHLGGPGMVSAACPFFLVMLGGAVRAKQVSGEATEPLELADVAR